jgi:hypothetical protein
MMESWPCDLEPSDISFRLGQEIGIDLMLLAAAISGMILSVLRFPCPV